MIFDRLAVGIQKHAKAIIVMWVVILCVSGAFAIQVGDILSYDTNEMAPTDSESMKGVYVMQEYFPSSSVNETLTPIIVVHFDNESEMNAAFVFMDELNKSASTMEGLAGVTYMDPMVRPAGDGILMGYMMMDSKILETVIDMTPDLRAYISGIKEETGFTGDAYLTGTPAISYDMEYNSLEDVSKIDPFTVLLILVLIGLFFRSFITSATPPITIAAAFVVTMALIFGLGHIMNIFFITNVMILVSMMGAGCDYCIFIIARYREELRNGKGHDEALHEAIVWAGESITISGASVIIGFGALTVCSYSLISTMGICLALGIIMALLAALTLIPSILQLVGDKVFWPTTMKEYEEGGKATKGWYAWCGRIGDRYFHRSVEFSIKHAKAIAIVAILITVPSVYVMVESEDSYDMISSMLSGDSGKGMDYIAEYADQGMVMPDYSIIEYREPIATVSAGTNMGLLYWTDYWYDKVSPSLGPLYAAIADDDNVAYVDGPFEWNVMLDEIEKAGITDTDAKIQYIKDHISAKAGLVFNQALAQMEERGLSAEYLLEGPGQIIDNMLLSQGFVFDWDAAVAEARASGLTDPSDIVAAVLEDFAQTYPEQPQALAQMIMLMKLSGLTDDILVDGFAPVVDYIMNVFPATVGGDFVKTGSGSVTYISVLSATVAPAMSPRSMDTIEHTKEATVEYVEANSDIAVQKWNSGTAVVMYEVSESVKSQFTKIEVLVVVLIIIMLFVVMRSYLIPLRSALTILMSISWTLAVTHLLFVDVLGGEVLWMVPILLLVICLGLGMDYDILLTTRIRENVMARGMSNDDGIRAAVVHTGSVITICGLIMGGAFGTLMISSMTMLQQFGFALCFAILVDALIVRTYIVPAIMHLLGDWNWKGPGRKGLKKAE